MCLYVAVILSLPYADPFISECFSRCWHSMPNINLGRLSRTRESKSSVIECHKLALIFHTSEALGSVTQRLSVLTEIQLFLLDAVVFEVNVLCWYLKRLLICFMELELMYGNCSYSYTQFLLLHMCFYSKTMKGTGYSQ